MSAHEANKPLSDDWHTPPDIIAAFPPFDLDPCASDRQTTITARQMIHWPTNGLTQLWAGVVWLNPPYESRSISPWLERMVCHGDGIALLPARVDVAWFHRFVFGGASGLFFFRGRPRFISPDERIERRLHGRNGAFPVVLASYGERCLTWLAEVKLPGRFVRLESGSGGFSMSMPLFDGIPGG